MKILSFAFSLLFIAAPVRASPLKLWYNGTASTPLTQGLMIGNGRMGGIVMGNAAVDTIYLNESSLWTGDANTSGNYSQSGFGAYQIIGTLALNLPGNPSYTNLRRELDIGDALATITYTSGGVDYTRKVFASNPDQVMVVRLTANAAGAYSGTLVFTDSHSGTVTGSGNAITVAGMLSSGIQYGAKILVLNTGGSLSASGGTVTFTGCDSLTIVVADGTNYVMDSTQNWQGPDPAATIAAQAANAAAKSYETLESAHEDDFHALFNRVALDVGTTAASIAALPTNQRIAYAAQGSDPDLEELLYQYGRYLLISCSRPGGLPANLQGLWASGNSTSSNWFCDYHTNINVQMNYWGAEVSNLSECHLPLLNLIQSQIPVWRLRTADLPSASKPNGTPRGWTVRTSHNITGGMGWNWNVSANAWYALHFWEHYAFTGDLTYLQKVAYPLLKEVCQYWQDDLKTSSSGLVVPNGWSPEHGPFQDGTSYDQEFVWNVFNHYIQASEILGVDADFRATVTQLRDQLYKPAVGSWGQLTEWMNTSTEAAYATNPEIHRHTSHLVGLYPASEITPDLDATRAAAAQVSLVARGETGDSQSEWAAAWRTGLWARLRNGDMARHWLDLYFSWGCNPNLIGNLGGTPQWDGTFGFSGTIPEMLLQSHAGFLDLLPALPSGWSNGSMSGLKARGGYTVDIAWQDGDPTAVTIHNPASALQICRVRYGDHMDTFAVPAGGSVSYVPAPVDIGFGNRTVSGIASASAQLAGNGADNASDEDVSTVWKSAITGGSAWLQYQFTDGLGWAVTQYKLASKAGGAATAPRDWRFLGSNDGTNWTILDKRSGETFSDAGETKRYRFTNEVPFSYYRLNVTATSGGSSGVALAEFQLWSKNGDPAASASTEGGSGETSAQAFDGSTGTKWYDSGAAPPGWLQYRFGNAAGWAVSEYRVTSANDVANRDPKDWQFQGSNDGTAWTTLDTRSGETFSARLQTKAYTLANTTPWRYYRLNILNNLGGSGYGIQLSEFLLKSSAVLSAVAGDSQVTLSWSPVPGAASYNLKRATSSSGSYITIGSALTALTYTDSGLANGTMFFYKIAPVFSGTEGAESAVVAATPEALTGKLSGKIIGTSGSYNNTGNTKEMAMDGSLATYFDAPVGTGAWVGLDLGTASTIGKVRYCPRSDNASRMVGGKFQGSDTADFSSGVVDLLTIGATPPTGSMTSASLSITTPFRYARYLSPANGWGNVAEVEFYDASVQSSAPQPPAAPQSLVSTGGSGQVSLSWSASADATGYTLWRAPATGGMFQMIASGIPGTSYTDSGLANGTGYYYLLAATSAGGTSDSSGPAFATTYTTVENWRLAHFGTISNAGNAADSADPDGDGMMNAQEFASGTDPNDSASILKVSQMQVSGGDVVVSFPTVIGKTYRLERSDTLQAGSWATLQAGISGTGGVVEITDNGGAAQARRFYRLVVE